MTTSGGRLAGVSEGRVLVVDDNPANTLLVKRILNRAGLPDVRQLHDPLLVAPTIVEYDPDLVLLDLRMPVMDGFEVLAVIRRQAGGNYLPVIVVTADDSHASVERALAGGAHDFVSKPFDATELVLRVRTLLLNRFAYQELRRSRALLRARLDLFEPDLAGTDHDPTVVRHLIRRTIDQGAFDIALQPVVDMRDGSVVGVEALSRFPSDVLAGPGAWFAAALEVGLATELELVAVRKALALLPGLAHATTLAVNASPATVLGGLIDVAPEVPWTRVVLELTEHVPVEDYTALNAALAPLRAAGARIAVDDTGSGFASLRHILDLHPDIIKIDIAITRGIDTDPSRAALAGMLAHFAAEVGIDVIAEGVERAAQREKLLELGVVHGQGDLLGPPVIPA